MDDLELAERLDRIESFAELKEGWHEGWGEPISTATIKFARKMCRILYDSGETEFGIFPNPEGYIIFEWDYGSLEIWGDDDIQE